MAGVGGGDSTQQMQSVAAMCFGLLANAGEAVVHRDDDAEDTHAAEPSASPQEGSEAEAPDTLPSETLLRALERQGVELGDPSQDRSPNATPLCYITVGGVSLHFFRHGAVPVACAVSQAVSHSVDEAGGALLAERLCKAFVHAHGSDYMDAAASGRAKPFRKLFAPRVEEALICDAGRLLRLAARIDGAPDPCLAPAGHHIALVASNPGDGRWVLHGEVDASGTVFRTSFAPLSLSPAFIASRASAFDQYRVDVTHDHLPDSQPEDVTRAALEVNAVPEESFSIVDLTAELGCYVLSSLRLASLLDVCMHSRTASASSLLQHARAVVHALAKVRSTLEPTVNIVALADVGV
uniref:Uncharacterized protein n=1 Tax=Neobodo designis TaxID=312471 RepID=A0A7S1L355_NEODS